MSESMVRIERRKRGWTQRQLADACGCVPTAVANVERGSRMPSLTLAVALAGALDVSLAALSLSCQVKHQEYKEEIAAKSKGSSLEASQ